MQRWLVPGERLLEQEREQLALWVPVALGIGIIAWFALPSPAAWAGWVGACTMLALAALSLPDGGRWRLMLVSAGLLMAAGCVLIWSKAMLWGEPPLARPAYLQITGEVIQVEPQPAQDRLRVVLRPDPSLDLPRRIRINIAEKDWRPDMGKDAVLRFRARLMPPAPPAVPGGYDFAQRAFFMGLGATGRALPPVEVLHPSTQREGSLRQRLAGHIRSRLTGVSEGGIAAALATGDRGAISEADEEAMRRSGLAHLLSISGLHVTALIGAVVMLVYRLLALSPRLALRWPLMTIAAGAGALAGIGYTLLTGAEVPTIRSCIAALLVLGGLALGRDPISLRLVAAGSLVVLLFWPEALLGPSFQMSFAAVTVIIAMAETRWFRALTGARDEAWLRKAGRNLIGLFLTGLAVEAALTPIALHHFHQAGLLGAAANLIAIPLTAFVIMPAEAIALLLDSAGLGAPFWWITGKALALLLYVAHRVAAHPMATWALPVASSIPFAIIMAGGLWLILWRTRWRYAGLLPLIAGGISIAFMPAPDILVTGDGHHMAARLGDGRIALLRGGAGDYVRDTIGSAAGEGSNTGARSSMIAMKDAPGARCSRDMCAIKMPSVGQIWTVLATRSDMNVPWDMLVHACAQADIVVADRRLPKGCSPRWLKLDRAFLRQSGGVAIYLNSRTWRSVRQPGDRHPWIAASAR